MRRLAAALVALLTILALASAPRSALVPYTGGPIPVGTCLNIIGVGDSLTLGFPNLGNDAYPAAISSALSTTAANEGVGGAGWIKLGNGSSPNLTTRFPTEVYPQYATEACGGSFPYPVLVLWAGTNDICGGGGQTAAATYAAFQNYLQVALAAGANINQIVVATAISRGPSGTPCGGPGTQLNAYNADLVSGVSTYGYAIVRLDNDPNIGCTTCSTNLTYFQSDNVHLTDAGYSISTNLICLQFPKVNTGLCPAY